MTYTGLGPESGVLPCGRGGGKPSGFLLLASWYQCEKASGVNRRRETSAVGKESVSVLGKNHSLGHSMQTYCSTGLLWMPNPSWLFLGERNEKVVFQFSLKTVVSHSQATKANPTGGEDRSQHQLCAGNRQGRWSPRLELLTVMISNVP